MGLIETRLIKLSIILVSISLLFQTSVGSIYSQGVVTKEVVGSGFYEPGDEVDIRIRVPGDVLTLRDAADIVLALDVTGSMDAAWGASTRINVAKAALISFVNQTKADVSAQDPGDFVSLVTFSARNCPSVPGDDENSWGGCTSTSVCVPISPNCGNVDFPLSNMTGPNKTAINTAINNVCSGFGGCRGATTIGAGASIGINELFSNRGRPGAKKYLVLVSDGRQNTVPSPFEQNILQTAIDRGYVVFTIGLGGEIVNESTPIGTYCAGCPDGLSSNPAFRADGRSSGEEVLKDVACRTDTQRGNDNCSPTVDFTNNCVLNQSKGSPYNDRDCPDHYYYTNNPNNLQGIYVSIANEIIRPVAYQIIDNINMNVFRRITSPTIRVVDCATGNPFLAKHIDYEQYQVWFNIVLGVIPENTEVCIEFTVEIWDAATLIANNVDFDVAVQVNNIGLAASVDPDFDCAGLIRLMCITNAIISPHVDIQNTFIVLINPFDPWVKTTLGDVGSRGGFNGEWWSVNNIDRDPTIPGPGTLISADYLLIGDYKIHNNFRSLRWTQADYLNGADPSAGFGGIDLHMGTDPVEFIRDRAEKKCGGTIPPLNVDQPSTTQLASAVNNAVTNFGCNAVHYTGSNFRIGPANSASWSAGYNGKPAVVFVDGDFNINIDMNVALDKGLIFVANNTIIAGGVREIDGFLISRNNFYTYPGRGCNYQSSTGDNQLVINGAVHAFGRTCFNRNLAGPYGSDANEDDPAELINFEPKYLFLFKDIIGGSGVIYREVAP